VKDPCIRWRLDQGPAFDNQVSTLDWERKWAKITLERAEPGDPRKPQLTLSFEHELTQESHAAPPDRVHRATTLH
jgi:hypothetical protein